MHPRWWLIPICLTPVTVIAWLCWRQALAPEIDDFGVVLVLLVFPWSWVALMASYTTLVAWILCALVDFGWTSFPSRARYRRLRASTGRVRSRR